MPLLSDRAKLIAAFGALYVVWGTTYLGIKTGLDAGLPPAAFLAIRLVLASVLMFAIAKWRGASFAITVRKDRATIMIVGACLLLGGQYMTFVAEQFIPSGLASLIVALLPLWIALAESVFPDMQRPSPLGWLGSAIGFTGLAILVTPKLADISASGEQLIGIGFMVLGTWLWTTGSVYAKRHPLRRVDALVSTGYQQAFAAAVLIVIATIRGEWVEVTFSTQAVLSILYLAVIGSGVGFLAFIYALRHAPASKVMTYAYVNPVIAVFIGWLAGRLGIVPPEPLTASTLIGMAVIVGGVALATAAPTLPARTPVDETDEVAAEQGIEPAVEGNEGA